MTSGTLHDASWLVSDRTAGASQGAFAFNNIAVHVGDDLDAVSTNRQALARRLDVDAVVFAAAAHGARVALVESAGPDVQGVDALITRTPGVGIAAQGADCVMVGIATRDGWVAAVHCGWKGLVAGVVRAAVEAMAAAGADLDGARAHLGPSICPSCYRVDADRAADVSRAAPTAVLWDVESAMVDLRTGVIAQLRAVGVEPTWDPRCTAEDPDLYSFRRDGLTGRQALVIARRQP
ncbi:MAG: polyphenol oxidase family protein [Candidatus Nanopelagicales bacterium]|nr:polyphenol oxidase family protein [Candidatus Nanopelagicales bacterium]